MSMQNFLFLCLICCVSSFILTALIRFIALRKKIIDIPNARSSHILPTPRGGGLAIVICFLCALIYSALQDALSNPHFFAFLCAGSLITALGFWDDLKPLPASFRLIIQSFAALLALLYLGSIDVNIIINPGFTIPAPISLLILVLSIVWLLNLTNFMDGINGIAALQAICVAGAGAFLSWQLNGLTTLTIISGLLASATAGFILWNCPKGLIFMGDVGSSFLGFAIALFTLSAINTPNLFWSFIIMMGVFNTDATMTLLTRIYNRAPLSEAHRDHAYQIASRMMRSHTKITLCVGALNIFFLFPLALLTANAALSPLITLPLAYSILIMLWALIRTQRRFYP